MKTKAKISERAPLASHSEHFQKKWKPVFCPEMRQNNNLEPVFDAIKNGKALNGKTLLYVGGRTNQFPQFKKYADVTGATLVHHDGGLHESIQSLIALASRADAVMFPVDCISHGAMKTVKRICRQKGTKYFPLRSSGVSCFAEFIGRMGVGAAI